MHRACVQRCCVHGSALDSRRVRGKRTLGAPLGAMRPTICGWALQTPWSSRLVSCQLLARTVRRTPRRLRTSRATHQQGCRRTVQTVEPPSPLPGRWLLGVLGPPWLALTISQQLSQVCLHGPAGLRPVRRGRRRRAASAAVLLLLHQGLRFHTTFQRPRRRPRLLLFQQPRDRVQVQDTATIPMRCGQHQRSIF